MCEEKGEVNFASRFLQNDFSLARSWVGKGVKFKKMTDTHKLKGNAGILFDRVKKSRLFGSVLLDDAFSGHCRKKFLRESATVQEKEVDSHTI